MRIKFPLMLLMFLWTVIGNATDSNIGLEQITLTFYNETINIQYDPLMLNSEPIAINEESIVQFYHQINTKNYKPFINEILKQKESLHLNDWLSYELMMNSINQIYPKHQAAQKNIFAWFLLSKIGFDTRLTFLDHKTYVYVYAEDNVYDSPLIQDQGRYFVNLTSILEKQEENEEELNLLEFCPNKDGIAFGFHLKEFPKFPEKKVQKSISFKHGEELVSLSLNLDKNIYHLLKHYPLVDEKSYFQVPFSPTLSASLLPQLKVMLEEYTQQEKIQFLVSFTRSAFKYKEDTDHFGNSKPMIADELFHYKFSDCEDRSALFYRLVKELLDLPMIVIAYDDHLTVAVALENVIGKAIRYKNKDYYICDPTGPSNSAVIGEIPQGYEMQEYSIMLCSQ